jgi:hypothetical protein
MTKRKDPVKLGLQAKTYLSPTHCPIQEPSVLKFHIFSSEVEEEKCKFSRDGFDGLDLWPEACKLNAYVVVCSIFVIFLSSIYYVYSISARIARV